MNDPTQAYSHDAALQFPSLASLRAGHAGLLQRHREQGATAEILSQIRDFIRSGREAGAILDSDEERAIGQSLLDYWLAILYRAGEEPPDATLAAFDPSLAPELPDSPCPYVGLDAFQPEDAAFFFGRRRLLDQLLAHLGQNRLLAVVGPSGSGKSSLVRAGLLPALQAGALPGSAGWRYLPVITPGSDPLASLARAVRPAGVLPEEWVTQHAPRFRRDPHRLTQLLAATGPAPAVLVLDQFEELFTLCTDDLARRAIADNLLYAAQPPASGHVVVLTMRSDFEGQVVRLPELHERFQDAAARVTPLSAGELREAILKPAELVGLKFEPAVVDALVHDLLGEPAGLPLLQFTLLKLWEQRDRNRITWKAYQRVGGGRLALARSADSFYNSLIPEEQATARRILLRLVRPGEGLEATSNRVRRAALYAQGEAHDRIERVLDKLIAARLVHLTEGDAPADTQVEVSHEALIRNWPRLLEWLEAERAVIRQRLRLTVAAEEWAKRERDPSVLWRGALLEEAERHEDLNSLEQEFVQASREAIGQAECAREEARQRELRQARALAQEQQARAEEQAAAARRLRQRAFALALALVAALAAVVAALGGWQQARTNERLAATRAIEAYVARSTAEAEARVRGTAEAQAQQARATSDVEARSRTTAEANALSALRDLQGAMDKQATALAAQLGMLASPTATPTRLPPPITPPIVTRPPVSSPLVPTRPTPVGAATATGTATPRASATASPTRTGTPAVVIVTPNHAATAAALQQQLDSVKATQTAVAQQLEGYAQQRELTALVPDIAVALRTRPAVDAAGVEIVRAPDRLRVLNVNDDLWVKAVSPRGKTGWVHGDSLVFEGDPLLLPERLRYRVISNRGDLPFVYGKVVSLGGARGDYLLRDPRDEGSGFLWVPVGAAVIVLDEDAGSRSYGSGRWYRVFLVSPEGKNEVWEGWLPKEVIGPR